MTDLTIFDAWANAPAPPGEAVPDPNTLQFLRSAQDAAYRTGASLDALLAAYAEHGVAGGVLTKVERRLMPPFFDMLELDDARVHRMCAEIAAHMASAPGRFHGSVMLDPRLGFGAARHVAIAVEEYGISVIRVMPSLSNLDASDALCYPLYTAACERGAVVTINVGVPGPRQPAKHQRPMLVDDVALAFPDLRIVLAHVGHPWQSEVVALLNKHPNVFLMTSGFAPRYIPSEITSYMASSRGRDKVMWASDYPALTVERTVTEALALGLPVASLERYMGLNALEVFGRPAAWAPAAEDHG
jgi:predicted TIM-barrel fold metal-dependent hydrolase